MGRLRWVVAQEEKILDLRFCDLGLRLEGAFLKGCIGQLLDELSLRGFRFRPHFWLSEEWFSPDGIPGIAIPFYLAHPRLMRLERKMMLEVEGGTVESCMRILRHEAGHAVDTAYRLSRRRKWQQLFGKATQQYPEYYQPHPYSRSFVLHLDLWYAQSHPSEDFAETFAVWLKPRSRWRSRYRGWRALDKLLYVDELMEEVKGQPPRVRSRRHFETLRTDRKTLRRYYEEKKATYRVDSAQFYDSELRRLFTNEPKFIDRELATAFLQRKRPYLRSVLSRWTGQYQYTIDQMLDELIERCKKLRLRLRSAERQVMNDLLVMLTVQMMNYIHSGHHRLAL